MSEEWVKNQLLNRFRLNSKKRVGAVVEMIRDVRPTTVEEWEVAYKERSGLDDGALDALGDELFSKREVLEREIAALTQQGCRDYVRDVLFRRTFDGYMAERDLVAAELERRFKITVEHATDLEDRTYGIDLVLDVAGRPMAVQVKPASFATGFNAHTREAQLALAHQRFLADRNGMVYTIVYDKKARRIENPEVFVEIELELERRQGGR